MVMAAGPLGFTSLTDLSNVMKCQLCL
jgi:hypothetical protein